MMSGLRNATPVASAEHLPPQQMEVLGRRRAICHLHVILRAECQESLYTRAGVLRPLPFVPVRQQEYQSAGLAPLRLGRRKELVNHDLCAVDEVAELRFPKDQRQRVSQAVTNSNPRTAYSLSELS